MAPSVQEFFKFEDDYYKICREERNIAAMLYHVLLLPDNLEKFLEKFDCKHIDGCEEAPIYLEFAYLRDRWHRIDDNGCKKHLILEFLNPPNKRGLYKMDEKSFNQYFGGPKNSKAIAFPGRWSIPSMNECIRGDFFLDVCKFKWAFNIKPDIVIHTGKETAVCVEAKFDSSESKYPSSNQKKEFERRLGRNESYRQTEIQKYMFEKLLGMKTLFVLLQKDPPKSPPERDDPLTRITWAEVFGKMNLDSTPKFIKYWVEHNT